MNTDTTTQKTDTTITTTTLEQLLALSTKKPKDTDTDGTLLAYIRDIYHGKSQNVCDDIASSKFEKFESYKLDDMRYVIATIKHDDEDISQGYYILNSRINLKIYNNEQLSSLLLMDKTEVYKAGFRLFRMNQPIIIGNDKTGKPKTNNGYGFYVHDNKLYCIVTAGGSYYCTRIDSNLI